MMPGPQVVSQTQIRKAAPLTAGTQLLPEECAGCNPAAIRGALPHARHPAQSREQSDSHARGLPRAVRQGTWAVRKSDGTKKGLGLGPPGQLMPG